MDTCVDYDPAPPIKDIEAWRQAVLDGRLGRFRFESIVAAIQDLGPGADKSVLNPLAKHLSDCMLRMLRKLVSIDYSNRGEDVVERVHGQLWMALLDPASKDGRGLRKAFQWRVRFRVLDELAKDARSRSPRPEQEDSDRSQAAVVSTASSQDPDSIGVDRVGDIDEQLDVESILERIPDYRKRLAFRLYMDGVPFKSTRSDSIAEAVGISERTARQWIKEAQELLKRQMGDVS